MKIVSSIDIRCKKNFSGLPLEGHLASVWANFQRSFGLKNISQIFFSCKCRLGRGWGPKNSNLSSYISHLTMRIVEPQINELAIFFIKWTTCHFGFCAGNCWKFLKLVHSGPIGRPLLSKRPTIWGPKYRSWQFFHKTDPL